MTWDARTGTFSPGLPGIVSLPSSTPSAAGSPVGSGRYITVQDLIDFGLLSGAQRTPTSAGLVASISAALEDSAASIELNSATLFKKMNGAAGVVIGSAGIAAYNSAGTATLTIDPETGNVTLSGTITATAGAIGGFTLGATTLTAGTGSTAVGIASSGTYLFYAGHATPASAPFRVAFNGDLATEKETVAQLIVTSSIDLSGVTGPILSISGTRIGGTATTGSGNVVLASGATLSAPNLGTPASGTLTNCSFPTLNQNTTGSSGSCTGNAATASNAALLGGYARAHYAQLDEVDIGFSVDGGANWGALRLRLTPGP